MRARLLLGLVSAGLGILACDRTARVDPEPHRSAPSASAVPDAPAGKSAAPVAGMPSPEASRPYAEGSNAFAFALWPRLGTVERNLAFSPASISLAFAMVYPGAEGETAAQVKKVLHFPSGGDATAAGWGALQRGLVSPARPLKLRIANRLFGEKTYAFEPRYLDTTKTVFDAPLEPVDFKHSFEPARERINGWVEETTEKRIKDLLPPRAIDELTRLVLVNAVYFLADWQTPFKKAATSDAPFELAGGQKKPVPMMHARQLARFAAEGGVKVLEMPYVGGDVAMLVVLPDARDGLAAVEKTLSAERLASWTKALSPRQIAIALPRFEVTTDTIPLAEQLSAMGMATAFDREKADFTRIANPPEKRERLRISNVFHKAFVKVDEKGTEAAAATAIVMAEGGGAPPPAEPFVADHPFLFFVVERTSGLVLFAGRVADPSAK